MHPTIYSSDAAIAISLFIRSLETCLSLEVLLSSSSTVPKRSRSLVLSYHCSALVYATQEADAMPTLMKDVHVPWYPPWGHSRTLLTIWHDIPCCCPFLKNSTRTMVHTVPLGTMATAPPCLWRAISVRMWRCSASAISPQAGRERKRQRQEEEEAETKRGRGRDKKRKRQRQR